MALDWQQNISITWQKTWEIIKPLALAIAGGFLFSWLKIPVAWLIGPLLMGVAYSGISGNPTPFPSSMKVIGKAILGAAAATGFLPETLMRVENYALPLLLGIMLTGILCIGSGYLLWRWSAIDMVTSFLGFIPGLSSTIVAMSEELGADPTSVAMLQYLRLITVSLIVPIIVGFVSEDLLVANPETLLTVTTNIYSYSLVISLLLVTACCSLGTLAGNWLKLPTKEFLGSFLLGICLFWSLPNYFYVPKAIFIFGLILIGVSSGLKFELQIVTKLWKALLLELFLVISLILCCLGIGYEFHQITHVDLITSLLAFVPGGMEAMIATANQLGGEPGLLLAIKFSRQMLILLAINLFHVFFKSTKTIEYLP